MRIAGYRPPLARMSVAERGDRTQPSRRVLLWVRVERNRVEFGRIYDLNDVRPLMTGALVPDYIWTSMLELLIRIRPAAPAR